jgi:hypothetical protein
MRVSSALSAMFCFLMAADPVAAAGSDSISSRYPTSDEAFYVLACMETNGQNAEGMQKCSCAVNAIEAELPYEQYSEAALVFAMRQAGGEKAALFRDTVAMKEVADRFIRAQARANRQCFGMEGPPPK